MPTNDFIGFATGGAANVITQAEYAASSEITDGMAASSMASSKKCNKVWRQGANIAAAIGAYNVAKGFDARDDGDLITLGNNVADAIDSGKFNRLFFSQTSGSYTAPRTGTYRITLKGGGGGGGGAQTTTRRGGGGGGEGAINIFYVQLTKNTAYNYAIGAGGVGGASGESSGDISNGTAGGDTTFAANGITYTALGGGGGYHSQTTARGGLGGGISPTTGYGIPGANGSSALYDSDYGFQRASGGGNRGTIGNNSGLYGGGGGGASASYTSTNGADGFILIEYAD